ncbi:HPr family phosphocarrier protein [Neotabrizicola shimadae]|uniref:HPr family phosphocarrier protein n=1 Tax=Neotabrizicola shimadae TaxID=2807096 RepID=A0A8G0ZVM1_9RHOB|nr:HPr family phosphocarrier protein [Neotabrizicola shimadae]QYZ69682.1 HPr family phosphocarrier protein [Neotabrizicola shimadae]
MTTTIARSFRIVNEKGLHARASAKFVEVVEAHDAKAEVSKDGMTVSGDSIMGLLMLAASRGTTIEVETSGAEAEKLADALQALVAGKFGEDY